MATERLLLRDVIAGFAPEQSLRASLMLTFGFDGTWLEEGLVPDLFDREVGTCLVIRDGNALVHESPSVRYHRANAQFSTRVFHPKLILLVAADRALAAIGSANLTRGGLERNLELASVHEVSSEGGSRALFAQLLAYIGADLAQEVSGTAAAALADVRVALSDVIKGVPKDSEPKQRFLHNYRKPIWEQVLALLPHRHVARLSIVSPFYEPNHDVAEDPEVEPGVDGIFARMFEDLTFEAKGVKPATVYFQQSEGETLLPVDTLRAWDDQIALRQRLSTTDDARPLHAKMLIIEGARGPSCEPYLVTVHGSPNFTSAAMLSTPPDGNAEIAVVTILPWKRNANGQVHAALQLDALFGEVDDWGLLTHVSREHTPPPGAERFRISDASFQVADRKLRLQWTGATDGATRLLVLIALNGAFVRVAEVALGADTHADVDAPLLVALGADGLLSLQAGTIRVELRDADDALVASVNAPLNVDCPAEFCGLVMVGPMMTTLDEQIAHAGSGVPISYREQLKFLEQHRTMQKKTGRAVSVLTHQADLDRFFRNLHVGFRGLRRRQASCQQSEYALRRTFKDLGRWCSDAIHPDSAVPTVECRLFLVDRTCREMEHLLASQGAKSGQKLPLRLGKTVVEYGIAKAVDGARVWAKQLSDPRIRPYVKDTMKRLKRITALLGGS